MGDSLGNTYKEKIHSNTKTVPGNAIFFKPFLRMNLRRRYDGDKHVMHIKINGNQFIKLHPKHTKVIF